MPLLSKTAILAANDLQTKDIEVPEWGGAVRVRNQVAARTEICPVLRDFVRGRMTISTS